MNKAPRVIAIGLAIVILFALIAYNAANPGKPNFVAWNENMTLGDKETAKHHYVMYTDLFCPYCDKFSLAVKAHKDEFQKEYLEDKGVYFEIRMTRMNYVSHKSENSKNAAIARPSRINSGTFTILCSTSSGPTTSRRVSVFQKKPRSTFLSSK